MANPLKNGDAKPRVYNHAQRDHDSPVTEDKIILFIFVSLVKSPGLFFGTLSFVR
jgi:hypothetical protein